MTEDGNSRVTVAVLKSEMSHLALTMQAETQHLAEKLDRNHAELCRKQDDHEERIRSLEKSAPWSFYRDLAAYLGAIVAGIVGALTGK